MNTAGKISLAGFAYHVGAIYAGESVEVVAAKGLVDIIHAVRGRHPRPADP